jgi:hypothetical protein
MEIFRRTNAPPGPGPEMRSPAAGDHGDNRKVQDRESESNSRRSRDQGRAAVSRVAAVKRHAIPIREAQATASPVPPLPSRPRAEPNASTGSVDLPAAPRTTVDTFTRDKWAWIQTVMRDGQLSPSTRLVAADIVFHLNRLTGDAWPSQETMANNLHLGLRTVSRAISELEGNNEAGRCYVTSWFDGRSKVYKLCLDVVKRKPAQPESADTRQIRHQTHANSDTEHTPNWHTNPLREHVEITQSPPTPPRGCAPTGARPHPRKQKKKGQPKEERTELPEDWTPSKDDVRYGTEKLGLSEEQVQDYAEDMRLWAGANGNRPEARRKGINGWSLQFKGWMRRGEGKCAKWERWESDL